MQTATKYPFQHRGATGPNRAGRPRAIRKSQKGFSMRISLKKTALRVAIVYLLVAGAWIVASDAAAGWFITDPETLTRIQTYKGAAFVTLTALLLYLALHPRLSAAENEQRELEQFRFIVENAGQEIFLLDETGGVVYANPAAEKSLGLTAEELANRNMADFDAAYKQDYDRHLRAIQAGEERPGFETTHTATTGTICAKEVKPIDLRIGERKYLCVFASDITLRKQHEEALRNSQEKYRAIVDAFDGLIYMCSPDRKIEFMNRPLIERTGRNAIEEPCHRVLHDLEGPCPWCTYDRVLNGETVYRDLFSPRDNRWYYSISSPVYNADGSVSKQSLMIDITARKRAEEALAAEKERLAVTLRSIGDGVITTDTDGIVTTMNKVAEELTGWRQEEAAGKVLDDVFILKSAKTAEPYPNPVENVISSGQIESMEEHAVLVSRDNREYRIADSGAPIRDRNSRIIGVVVVFRDITDKQKLIESARNTEKLESLGLLAGGIAHDFNNLLGGIYGYIEIARLKNTDTKVSELLGKSLDTIDRARRLTRQLLTFAKGGDPVRNVQPLNPLIEDTARFLLSGTGIPYRFDLPDDLLPVNYDETQIRQVIENVLLNACEAMADQNGEIAISAENTVVKSSSRKDTAGTAYVRISVEDSGEGISGDILPHIFDPYFTTKPDGHGIGLTTCFSVIRRHGGFVDVETEPGKGSVFHIFLPAENPAVPAAMPKAEKTRHETGNSILVMDDEEVVRQIMSEMLESLGFTALCRADGEELLRLFAQETRAGRPPAGIIVDLTVPGGMGGMEVIHEIRSQDPDVPVFVASGYSGDPVMAKPGAYGFTASLKKPFQLRELKEILETHLSGESAPKSREVPGTV